MFPLLSGCGTGFFLQQLFTFPGTIDDAKTWWEVLTMSDWAWLFIPLFLINILWIAVPLWYPHLTGAARLRSLTPLIDDLLRLGAPGPNFERDAKGATLNQRLDSLSIPHPDLMIRGDGANIQAAIEWAFFLVALRSHADSGELKEARTLYERVQSAFKRVVT